MTESETLDRPSAPSRGGPGPLVQADVTGEAGHGRVPLSASVLASAALTACGGGEEEEEADSSTAVRYAFADTYAFANSAPASPAEAARFLQQAQFASTTSAIADVRASSYADWLGRQLGRARGATAWDWLDALGYGDVNSSAYYNSTAPADYVLWNQLLNGQDPVRRRMALALSEFFVVSTTMMDVVWRSHVMAHWWDTLVEHAFGNFRDLLEAVTLHPAMGYFLNTRGNLKENSSGRVPDENYAREVMQLFTIGLVQLNTDGSVKTDGAGRPLETYSSDEVSNLARVFTGYDNDYASDARVATGSGTSTIYPRFYARRPMKLTASNHSMLAASFLGTTIPADTPGQEALRLALDTLFEHPNVGPFFGRQMIQRLVTSNPSPAYVARVAAVFNDNGSGVRGDLRAVWTAILLDDEARGTASLVSTSHGKLREPMLRFIQWGQTFGVTSKAGSWKLGDLSDYATRLGQSPLRSSSVFNFFRPGYVPPATALADAQATAPEFQLVNETSVGGYLNFMQSVIRNGWLSGDLVAAYSQELTLVTDAGALLDHVILVLAAGQVSEANRTLMLTALQASTVTATSSESVKLNRVAAAVFMVMACADYLVQR